MTPGPNQGAYDAAYTQVAQRVYDVCGREADDAEVSRVVDTYGVNLAGVCNQDIWDAATEGADWPHGNNPNPEKDEFQPGKRVGVPVAGSHGLRQGVVTEATRRRVKVRFDDGSQKLFQPLELVPLLSQSAEWNHDR